MNKIISTTDRTFMAVCGPSCCGKTELIYKMLHQNTFSPKFESIFYFYQHDQPKCQFIERKINTQFIKLFSSEQLSELNDCFLVFNDSCFSGHLFGILFCLYIKIFPSFNFSFIGPLSSKTVVLDVKGFRHKKRKIAFHFYLQQVIVS